MEMDDVYFEHYQLEHDWKILEISPNQAFVRMIRDCILQCKPSSILDVGSGSGHISGPLSGDMFVVGADIDRLDMNGLKRFRGFNPVLSDACRLSFRDNSFDFALCNEVLEHIPPTDTVLGEISRVTRDGGMLLVTVPNGSNIPTYIFDHVRQMQGVRRLLKLKRRIDPGFKHHYHEFNIFSIRRALEKYYDIIAIKNTGFIVPVLNRTIKNLRPSLFRRKRLRKFLYFLFVLDACISRLDVFHVFPEHWIILCKKRGDYEGRQG